MGEATTQDDRKYRKNIKEGQQPHGTKCHRKRAAHDHTRNGSKIILRGKVDNIK